MKTGILHIQCQHTHCVTQGKERKHCVCNWFHWNGATGKVPFWIFIWKVCFHIFLKWIWCRPQHDLSFIAHPKFLLARVQCFVKLLELVHCFTQFNAPCQDVIERRLARWWFCTRGLPRISGSLTPVGHISSFRPYSTSQSSCQHDYGECCLRWNNSHLVSKVSQKLCEIQE